MAARPLRRRRFAVLKILVVATIAATTVFSIGYRQWAYNSWMEYRLVCTNGNMELYEITRPPTLALQDAIEEYKNIFASKYTGSDRPYYRDGDRFYMRPWYYNLFFGQSLKSTEAITNRAIGGNFNDFFDNARGIIFCSTLYQNSQLFAFAANRGGATEYIVSQNFDWFQLFLRVVAPPPEQ